MKRLLITLLILTWSGLLWATGITFTFANSIISEDANGKYLEFDVMAQADAAGTKIGDTQVYINYNTVGFGSSIVNAEKVWVEKGELLQNDGPPYYNEPVLNDNTSSRFSIGVEFVYGDYPQYGNDLPTSPTQLLHVKMQIADSSQTSDLTFEQSLMEGQEYESDNTTKYDPVVADDTLDVPLKKNPLGLEALDENGLPSKFHLYPNYPNPFNPSTTLRFDVPQRTQSLSLIVYDLLGRQVAVLFEGEVQPGSFTLMWNGLDQNGQPAPSGVYFAVLKGNNFRQTIKMMLMK